MPLARDGGGTGTADFTVAGEVGFVAIGDFGRDQALKRHIRRLARACAAAAVASVSNAISETRPSWIAPKPRWYSLGSAFLDQIEHGPQRLRKRPRSAEFTMPFRSRS